MTARFLTLVTAIAFLASPASFADETLTDADKLVSQLGSSKFAEREAALKALEEMGPAALPALRRGAEAKDQEVRQRVADLIAKYERQADSDAAFVPTKVRLKFAEAPLAEVIGDLAKQAKVRIQLAREPADLASRRVTIDTGETSFWHALDRLCQEARVSLRSPAFDPSPSEEHAAAAGPVRFIGVSGPRTDDNLVIQDGLVAECPTAYLGAVRVRLIPDRWGNRNRGPGEEHKWTFEVMAEPKFAWQSVPTVQFGENSTLKVSANSRDDNAAGGIVQLPGGGAVGPIVVNALPAGNFRLGGGLTSSLPRNVSRHEIAVSLKSDSPSGTLVPELTGSVAGTVRLAPQELAAITDVQKAENAEAKTKDGTKVTVKDCKVADGGEVTMKVDIERLGPGGGIAGNAVMGRIQVAGGGALPANVARAINPMMADGDSFKLFDAEKRPYTVSISETSSNSNNGVTVVSYTLQCEPADKDAKPKRLELHGPRRAPVESKFTLRNVATP